MKKLTILVDMDDTIENLTDVWISELNKRYGTHVTRDDIKEWDMQKAFPTLTKTEIYSPLCNPDIWDKVRPIPEAREYMGKMRRDGHKIYIVSASHPETVAPKLNKVLFRYFPEFKYDDVIITSHKQLIKGDVLIDDAPHNLEGGDYIKVLFGTPKSRKFFTDDKNFYRANDWKDVYDIIKYIAEE